MEQLPGYVQQPGYDALGFPGILQIDPDGSTGNAAQLYIFIGKIIIKMLSSNKGLLFYKLSSYPTAPWVPSAFETIFAHAFAKLMVLAQNKLNTKTKNNIFLKQLY